MRDAFVDDSQGRLYDEALDVIERDYYRPVDRDALLNTSIEAAVKSLNDRFSNYFDPKSYQSFQEATNGAFEGVGMNVEQADRGPAGADGVRRLAGEAGRHQGGRPDHEGQRAPAQGQVLQRRHGADQGPRGLERDADRPIRQAHARRQARAREGHRSRGQLGDARARAAARSAHVTLAGFTDGAGQQVGDATRRLLDQGAKGIVLDLRDNGGGLLNEAVVHRLGLHPQGHDRQHGRPRAAEAHVQGDRRRDRPQDPRRRAGQRRVGLGVGDRHRRAAGPHRAEVVGTRTFGKGVFQEIEPLPNGGALDITVGEYFLPSGRNLGGGGVKQGAGIKPDVAAQDDPKTTRDEALDVAVRTVARESA